MNTNYLKQIILLLCFSTIVSLVNAQENSDESDGFSLKSIMSLGTEKEPIKFGKVDVEDLKMTRYELDTSAVAVVLCDYGYLDPDDFEFTRICRIKILKKEGLYKANVRVNSRQHLILKAKTYNLEDGKIVETKMKREAVFEDRVDHYIFGTRFTLPDVKVGSVIEYEYKHSGIPFAWLFQIEIPVMWSELRIEPANDVQLLKNFYGFEALSVISDDRWVAKNVPAFRPEPFINSAYNYLTRYEFDIRKIDINETGSRYYAGRKYYYRYSLYEDINTSWEEISRDLLEDRNFGVRLSRDLFLISVAKDIEERNLSNLEKAKCAYHMIQEEISWDDTKRLYAYSNLSYVYNTSKSGSSAEINLLLMALLNRLDFNAKAVMLSTRDNGIISHLSPSVNKLNYVIVQVDIDGKNYLLDATDKHAPFGMLPIRSINGEGRLVDKENSKLIKLSSNLSSKEIIYNNLEVTESGELIGNTLHRYYDYAAYNIRKDLEKYTDEDEYIRDLEKEHPGLSISNYEIVNLDSIYKPVSINCDVNYRNDVDIIADNIYISPLVSEKIDDNPFKIDEREYPVDFTYPIEKKYIFNVKIPTNYTVIQVPEPAVIKLPNNKGVFKSTTVQSGQNIQYIYQLNINDPIILPTEYSFIQEFYNMIVSKHTETIVLKRN